MVSLWPVVPLREVLSPVDRREEVVPGRAYRQIGVRLWGEGAYEREPLDGAETRYATLSRVEADDVVVNKIWARNGSVAVVPQGLAGCYGSNEFPTFAPMRERVLPRWLHWMTKTQRFWEECDARSRGTSGKNRIRPEQFLKVRIPLPPLPDQRRIAARIEELAGKIEEVQRLRARSAAASEAVLGARLNELFGNPYTDQRGTSGPGPFATLSDLVSDVADGPHATPRYVEKGIPFVTILNITSGRISFSGLKYITEEAHHRYQQRARAEKGDVLISKDGTIGVPCFVDTDREFSFFVSVALIKPLRDRLDGEFLTWALRAPYLQERMRERSRGDMIRHLVLREIRKLVVPMPSLAEQRRIVTYLDSLQAKVDSLKRMQVHTAAELDALLSAVLERAFAGNL